MHISHSIKAGIIPSYHRSLPIQAFPMLNFYQGTTTFAMFPAIIEGERYILIDTPGFNDENQSDIEIFSIILKWFQTMSQYCNLAGILYVHDISQKRVSGSAKLNLDMLKALCGPGFYKNVTILTTMWGDAGPSKASERQQKASESRQKEFENGPWKELIDGGARVMAHKCGFAEPDSEDFPVDSDDIAELDEQREEAREELFRMIDYYKYSESISPEIQSELRRGVGLLETKAGAVLRKSKGLPPTPETIDGEGKTAPSIPATVRIDDKAGVLQSASTIHVIHHIVESPPLDTGLGGKEGKNLNEKPKDPPPRGWWENLFRAVFWFFTGSGDSKKKQS